MTEEKKVISGFIARYLDEPAHESWSELRIEGPSKLFVCNGYKENVEEDTLTIFDFDDLKEAMDFLNLHPSEKETTQGKWRVIAGARKPINISDEEWLKKND